MTGTLRQIEVFQMVCREGSFAAAARSLGISQAAVSKHIASLETACRKELFKRAGGISAPLTEAGRRFHVEVGDLLSTTHRLGLTGAAARPVKIGADSVILNTILRSAPRSFMVENREVSTELRAITPMGGPEIWLAREPLDLAYFTMPLSIVPPTDAELIVTFQGCLYASPELAERWRATPSQPLPVILPLSGSPLEKAMLGHLAQLGAGSFRVALNADYEHALELAQMGEGAVFMSQIRGQPAVRSGTLVEVSDFCPPQPLGRYSIQFGSKSAAIDTIKRKFSELIRCKSTPE